LRPLAGKTLKGIILCALVLTGVHAFGQSQESKYDAPSWYFGAAAGANFNFYRGSTQELNSLFTAPAVFREGNGAGLFMAPLLEFHRPDSRLGFMLQAGYDNRKGSYKQIMTPCNCPADLSIGLSYITVEPSLRLAPFKSGFFIYAGPRLAFALGNSFLYSQKINPDFPEQVAPEDVTGDLSYMKKTQLSLQVGAGYDINLSDENSRSQAILSPFVSFQPYFGQMPRSIETWNITTIRVGAALKFGIARKARAAATDPLPMQAIPGFVEPAVEFTINAPANIPAERNTREIFPLRNYVFFNLGSTEIHNRYALLRKDR
jgi:opacity protein-like surface antigen